MRDAKMDKSSVNDIVFAGIVIDGLSSAFVPTISKESVRRGSQRSVFCSLLCIFIELSVLRGFVRKWLMLLRASSMWKRLRWKVVEEKKVVLTEDSPLANQHYKPPSRLAFFTVRAADLENQLKKVAKGTPEFKMVKAKIKAEFLQTRLDPDC